MELINATNLIEQLDAIGDLLYVIYGAGSSFGIDLDDNYKQYIKTYKFKSTNIDVDDKTNFIKTYKLCEISGEQHSDIEPKYLLNNFKNKIFELGHALLMCNITDIKYILTDMLFSLYYIGYICDYNMDTLFAKIHASNMSKICCSEQEAIDTVKWYLLNQKNRYPERTGYIGQFIYRRPA